jgi:hypothetical protein
MSMNSEGLTVANRMRVATEKFDGKLRPNINLLLTTAVYIFLG